MCEFSNKLVTSGRKFQNMNHFWKINEKVFFWENSSEKRFVWKNPRWNFSFFQKISWKTCFLPRKRIEKRVTRKFDESLAKVSLKLSDGHPKVSVKLSPNFRVTLFSMRFLGKKTCFSAVFFSKNEKFHLGFYQKKGFRLNFLQKMTFSLICPNDVFFFTETFSQKLTNLSEISHVIPCYSLLCVFVCFQRIAFPPVRFK